MPTDRRRQRRAGCVVTAIIMAVATVLGVYGIDRYLAPQLLPQSCRVVIGKQMQTYTPEQMANASTIAAVAVRKRLPVRAVTIAIATAMQESKLRNLDHGDRDSLGLFQQRPSQGWGTPAQLQDPVYASEQFYSVLVEVKDYRTRPLTEVAQQVQRSGYPDAYADHEAEAELLAQALTGRARGAVSCRLDDRFVPTSPKDVAADLRREIGVSPDLGIGEVHGVLRSVEGAWATGAWAVAHAQQLGIETVTVADRRWTRGRDRSADTWETVSDGGRPTEIRLTLQK